MNNVMEGNYQDESEVPKPVKKKKPIPNKEFLEDNKEHVALVRASLQFADEGNDYDNYGGGIGKYDVYEDEYDDTYDSNDVAAVDADSADELNDMNKRRSVFLKKCCNTSVSFLFFFSNIYSINLLRIGNFLTCHFLTYVTYVR